MRSGPARAESGDACATQNPPAKAVAALRPMPLPSRLRCKRPIPRRLQRAFQLPFQRPFQLPFQRPIRLLIKDAKHYSEYSEELVEEDEI